MGKKNQEKKAKKQTKKIFKKLGGKSAVPKPVRKEIRKATADLKIKKSELKNIFKAGGSKKQVKKIVKVANKSKKLTVGKKVDTPKEVKTTFQNLKQKGKIPTTPTKLDIGKGKGNGNGNGKGNGNGNGKGNGNDVEIPSGETGRNKPFVKYKPQAEAIEAAAKAKYDVRKKDFKEKLDKGEAFKPVKGTGQILEEFREGKKQRKERIRGLEKEVKRPDYAEYESRVRDIQKGKGPAASYAYSGKFQDLGKKLGVGYSPEERGSRTEARFKKLTSGLKSTYETPAQSRERRRGLGKQAMDAMRIG